MKKKRKFKPLFKLILLVIISLGIYYCVDQFIIRNFDKQKGNDKPLQKKEVKEVWPKTYEVNIVGTGDALIHKSIYDDAKTGTDTYDFTKQLKYIKPIIKKYDLAYYNGETIIGGKQNGISTYPCFNTPDEFADAMIDTGFNIVSLSSNHTMDKGEKGVLYSTAFWKEKKEMLTSGSYASEEERITPRIFEKNNIKYTMLSYTMETNGLSTPKGKEYYSVLYNDELAKQDIERVRDKVDVLIVSIHWGTEYMTTPTPRQKEIAKYLSELGVDIIYGTHPHVLQPIEKIGNTVVYYSLGNFISAQDRTQRLIGVLSSLKITKTLNKDQTSSIDLSDMNNELIYTYYEKGGGRWHGFEVIPFKDLDTSIFPEYKTYYATTTNILKNIDEAIPVVSLE